MAAGQGTAVIGASVKLLGELSGTEDLEFHGEVDGSIRLTGARLTIGPKASVRGDVSAQDVIILGRVNGNIHAKERADLRASAKVEGEISAARLLVEAGAELKVRVDPESAKPEPAPAEIAPAEAKPDAKAEEKSEAKTEEKSALAAAPQAAAQTKG